MHVLALIFIVLAIGAGVTGLYASPDQGLDQAMYWSLFVFLALAAASVFVHLALRLRGAG
ncbi:MAG: hypothetical protein R6X02_29870 [Enhygromyxa sp.]